MAAPETITMLGHKLLTLADGLSGALIGLVFYGLWAVWANHDHGLPIALRAGMIQGGLSFVVTLTGTQLMKTLYRMPGPPWWRLLRACGGALLAIYGLIVGAHLWNGTPNILLTLAPGLPITIAFCLSFCWGLSRYAPRPPSPRTFA